MIVLIPGQEIITIYYNRYCYIDIVKFTNCLQFLAKKLHFLGYNINEDGKTICIFPFALDPFSNLHSFFHLHSFSHLHFGF